MLNHRLRFSVISLLAFFVFSCVKDHVIPERIPAKIKTLEFVHALPTSTFKLVFEDLGNVPVVEYGIAMSKGISGQLEPVPTIANEILVFTSLPIDLNIKTQGYSQSFADVNYRAYAKLQDGTVIYGEVIKYRFQPG